MTIIIVELLSLMIVVLISSFIAFCCDFCLFQQLDEVQSYILAERSIKHHNVAVDSMVQEFIHVVSSSTPAVF